MNIETGVLLVGGVEVHVVRKEIKHLHLGVYPPDGRVRVAVPLAVTNAAVRVAVARNLVWIKRQRAAFARQPRQSEREYISGESHHFLGRRYLLRVVEGHGPGKIVLPNKKHIELHVRTGSDCAFRKRVLETWYRTELRQVVGGMFESWSKRIGVDLAGWGIRRMKTKWGTSHVDTRRIYVNLELAKKPVACIEYVIVHELVHFLAPHHDERFVTLMDRHLPTWRFLRAELNALPLAEEKWKPAGESYELVRFVGP